MNVSHRMTCIAAAAVLSTLLASGSVFAQSVDASAVAAKIQQGLGTMANVASSNVQAVNVDGKIVLEGSVGSNAELNAIKEMVEETEGVDPSMIDYRIVTE